MGHVKYVSSNVAIVTYPYLRLLVCVYILEVCSFSKQMVFPQKCSHPILLTSQKVWAPFLLSLCSKQIHSSHSFTCLFSPTFMLRSTVCQACAVAEVVICL